MALPLAGSITSVMTPWMVALEHIQTIRKRRGYSV